MTGTIHYNAIVETPLPVSHNKLGIVVVESGVQRIDFLHSKVRCYVEDHPQLMSVLQYLKTYFENPGKLRPITGVASGTVFQQTVWQCLQQSQCGEYLSYGELARHLESSARAVAGACRRNPIPIVVPCHRVVAKSGLGGFAGALQGDFIRIKSWLLQHEQIHNHKPHTGRNIWRCQNPALTGLAGQ